MAVLIISHPDDIHAHALIWSLTRKGIPCKLWAIEEFPEYQRLTARVSNSQDFQVDVRSLGPLTSYETVWARRVDSPRAISAHLAVADKSMALLEAQRCIEGTIAVIAPKATWINPPENSRLANAKAYQLQLARRIGFTIPDTIISNDPATVRAFVLEHNGDVIYKPFSQAYWVNRERNTIAGLFTSTVRPDVFDHAAAITSCPGIYQVRLAKKTDIRIVFFGDTFYGIRIFSQAIESGKLDFRADLKQEAPVESYALGADLVDQCNVFRRQLGLLHGSFDFVEQPDGKLVFLEINPMGQFLFLEQRVPTLPLLDAFTSFSLNPASSFCHKPTRDKVSFSEFAGSAEYLRAVEMTEKRMRVSDLNTVTYSE